MSAQNTAIRMAESALGTAPWNMNNAIADNIERGANVHKLGPPPGLPTLAQRRANLYNSMVGEPPEPQGWQQPTASALRAAAPAWQPPSTLRAAAPAWTPGPAQRKSRKANRKSRKASRKANRKSRKASRKNRKGSRK